jgi:hypothetical protein
VKGGLLTVKRIILVLFSLAGVLAAGATHFRH